MSVEASSRPGFGHPPEIERLLNPAYCACVLARFAHAFAQSQDEDAAPGAPLPLVFLCLPLALHERTRDEVNRHGRRFGLHRVVRGHPDLLAGLARRVEGFRGTTREALLFGSGHAMLRIDPDTGAVAGAEQVVRWLTPANLDDHAMPPIRAAERLGAWFGEIEIAEVFLHLGLRP
jgi:hypothetical protein